MACEIPAMNTGFRDTSEQDRPLASRSRRWPWLLAGGAVLAAVLALTAGGRVRQALSADTAFSASRLSIATVDVAPLTRDVAGEGRVVAAQSPTLFAQGAGTATLAVQAGDPVKKGQVLATIDSPELTNRLAQERSNVDALRADLARAEVEARQQVAALQSAYENARIDQQTAQNDLARQTQAFEAGATARMQVERAQDTLAKAKLALDQARDLREINPDVPPWLAAIVARLLAKSPAERFQSAAEVADLLKQWLAHLAASNEPLRLVLDDLPDELPAALNDWIERLLALPSSRVHLLVSCRRRPAWNLPRLMLRLGFNALFARPHREQWRMMARGLADGVMGRMGRGHDRPPG